MGDTVQVQRNYSTQAECLAAFSAVPKKAELCTAIMALDTRVSTLWRDLYAARNTLQRVVDAKVAELLQTAPSQKSQKLQREVEILRKAIRVTTEMVQETGQALRKRIPVARKK